MRTFGRLKAKDPRDQRFLLPRQESKRTRRKWRDHYWRGDQGNTPHCVGYAWCHLLAAAPLTQRNVPPPEGIYTLAQHLDEWPGEDYAGTSVRAGAKVMRALGYLSSYGWAFTLDPLVNHLLEEGPVVLGVNWYRGMMDTDSDGFIHPKGRLQGGHAVCLTEADTRLESVGFVQSWGVEWGLGGRGYLHFRDLERLLGEDGEACTAIESKPYLE